VNLTVNTNYHCTGSPYMWLLQS